MKIENLEVKSLKKVSEEKEGDEKETYTLTLSGPNKTRVVVTSESDVREEFVDGAEVEVDVVCMQRKLGR